MPPEKKEGEEETQEEWKPSFGFMDKSAEKKPEVYDFTKEVGQNWITKGLFGK